MQKLNMKKILIPKYIKRIVTLLFTGVTVYIVVCCLFPPLFKISNVEISDTEIQQATDATERICVVDDNEDALLWRLRLIQEAQEEIILVTFELRDDTSGGIIMAALLDAADRGVHIRLLVDGIDGELRLHTSQNFEAFLSHENIEVKFYNPLRLTALWKVNYRLHDKYFIIDDTAYILGGRNTHDVYLGDFTEDAQCDRDIVVYEATPTDDNSLEQLRIYFETMWELEDYVLSSKMDSQQQEELRKELAEHLKELLMQYDYPITPIDWCSETIEVDNITLLTGSPVAWNKAPVLWEQLCQLMGTAEYEIILETPVVICDDVMLANLTEICTEAVPIQIITNALEINPNLLSANYSNQKNRILEAGAFISEYCGDKPLHTKTILIDDNLSIIGSYNLDARSTYIDTEIMLVIESRQLNALLKNQIEEMQAQSKSIDTDGSVTYGSEYSSVELPFGRKFLNAILNVVLYPFQYLL